MARTPDYLTTQDIELTADWTDKLIIPAGSFVQPMDYGYVPKHCRDSKFNRGYDKNIHWFCYTRFGIFVLPKAMIRAV
jgi:hypothetical protein